MTTELAWIGLYECVCERFAEESIDATHYFGRRKSSEQKPGNTIVWMPGDTSGAMGDISGARRPGRNPRPLLTLNELFTIEITGINLTEIESEQKQYTETRLLYDAWLRAVYLAAHGSFQIQSSTWLVDKVQRSHGATIRVVIALQAMVPDSPQTQAPITTGAELTLSELDVDQVIPVPDA